MPKLGSLLIGVLMPVDTPNFCSPVVPCLKSVNEIVGEQPAPRPMAVMVWLWDMRQPLAGHWKHPLFVRCSHSPYTAGTPLPIDQNLLQRHAGKATINADVVGPIIDRALSVPCMFAVSG